MIAFLLMICLNWGLIPLSMIYLLSYTLWILDGFPDRHQSDVQMAAGPLDIAAGKQKDPEIRTRISLALHRLCVHLNARLRARCIARAWRRALDGAGWQYNSKIASQKAFVSGEPNACQSRSTSTRPCTMGEQWLLKQFCLNHPVKHIQKPKLPKLYVRVETSTSYFIIDNQFVK